MSAVPTGLYTLGQYLAKEKSAQQKSEFYRGEIFAMGGGSPRHNDISGNVYHALRTQLRESTCRPYNSDQRLSVKPAGLHTYADVSVVCGPLHMDRDDRDAITNPRVIFEVLSRSTERYDRGKKFELYRGIATLAEYVLISQDEPHIERFQRQSDNSWLLTEAGGLDAAMDLASITCHLTLAEIYDNVDFETHADLRHGD
jgi:Uma2 family endonuclease